jgi:phosphatidylglycerophosphate synthase
MFEQRLLQQLRTERYSPRAWLAYACGHLRLARREIDRRPSTVRSIHATGFTLFALIFVAAAVVAVWMDAALSRRLLLWCSLWLALHLGWVFLHLGLLADPEGRPSPRLGLPNTITLIRSLTVPAIVICLLDGRLRLGLALFAIGAVADVADGVIARRRGEVTRLGTALDPLVDMAWNSAAAFGLVVTGSLPVWVMWLVGMRYGLLLVGSAVIYFVRSSLRIQPTLFGKVSGAAISGTLVLIILIRLMVPAEAATRLNALAYVALGLLLTAAIVYVVVLGILNWRDGGEAMATGRVIGHVGERRSAGGGHGVR